MTTTKKKSKSNARRILAVLLALVLGLLTCAALAEGEGPTPEEIAAAEQAAAEQAAAEEAARIAAEEEARRAAEQAAAEEAARKAAEEEAAKKAAEEEAARKAAEEEAAKKAAEEEAARKAAAEEAARLAAEQVAAEEAARKEAEATAIPDPNEVVQELHDMELTFEAEAKVYQKSRGQLWYGDIMKLEAQVTYANQPYTVIWESQDPTIGEVVWHEIGRGEQLEIKITEKSAELLYRITVKAADEQCVSSSPYHMPYIEEIWIEEPGNVDEGEPIEEVVEVEEPVTTMENPVTPPPAETEPAENAGGTEETGEVPADGGETGETGTQGEQVGETGAAGGTDEVPADGGENGETGTQDEQTGETGEQAGGTGEAAADGGENGEVPADGSQTGETGDGTDEAGGAGGEDAAPDTEVEMRVVIHSTKGDIIVEGETIYLTSELIGFEGLEVAYQWQVDKGSGWENVEGATGDSWSYTATEETVGYSWRLLVYIE